MTISDWLTGAEREVIPAFVYVRLKLTIVRTKDLLGTLHGEGHIPYIAWLTRNLMELKIWVAFCARKEEHALEFFDDSLRDLVDLTQKVSGSEPEVLAAIAKAATLLDPTKAIHRFKEVKDAAAATDLTGFYKDNNKLFSKFAHPTAFCTIAPFSKEVAIEIGREMATAGDIFALEALAELDSSYLKERYKKFERFIPDFFLQ